MLIIWRQFSFPVPEGRGASMPDHFPLVKFVPIQFKRRGVEKKIVIEGDRTPNCVDFPLLKAVARARRWADDLLAGRVQSVDALAKQEGLDRRSVRRLLRLGFLSPRIVEMIADGGQPSDLTVRALVRRLNLPALWSTQRTHVTQCPEQLTPAPKKKASPEPNRSTSRDPDLYG